MNVSQKIYQLRTSRGLTQVELAKIAGVSDKAVSAWESMKREPKLKAIQNICDYFHIDLVSFIDEQEDTLTGEETKKQPPRGELSETKQAAWDYIQKMDDETLRRFIASAKIMLGE